LHYLNFGALAQERNLLDGMKLKIYVNVCWGIFKKRNRELIVLQSGLFVCLIGLFEN